MFLAPIFVIIVINVVFFIWIIVVVSRHTKEKANRIKQTITKKQILRILFSLSGVATVSLWSHLGLLHSHFLCFWSQRNIPNSLYCLLTHSRGSLCLFLFYLLKDLATGRPFCLVKSTDHPSQQATLLLSEIASSIPVKNQQNHVYTDLIISNLSKQG